MPEQEDFEAKKALSAVGADPWRGWGQIADTQYTTGSRFVLAADTETLLPNNAGSVLNRSRNGSVLFSGDELAGKTNDLIFYTVDFECEPQGANGYIEVWVDIAGAVGELYRRPFSFPKGAGVERHISLTQMGYTLDTWELNSAEVYVNSNVICEIWDIRLIATRFGDG